MDRPDDATALISALGSQRDQLTPRTCDLLAELYCDQGDLRTALEWADSGVRRCLNGGDKTELRLLLSLRYRSAVLPSVANPDITSGGLVGEGKTEYFRSMGSHALTATARTELSERGGAPRDLRSQQ